MIIIASIFWLHTVCQALCLTSTISIYSGLKKKTWGINTIIISILKMRKLRFREVEWVAQGYKANNWQNGNANPELCDSKDEFLHSQICMS